MKRLLSFATFFICSLLTTLAQFSGSGNGTEDDPYLIFNETQLSQVSNFLNQEGVVFKLMKDLDVTEWIAENNPRQGWLPIGVESMPFMGVFQGNNHKVSGLMINRTSTDYVGLFGHLSGATITNLTIEGSAVMGASKVGGFCGYASGATITNCNLTLTNGVEGTSYVGGFVGQSLHSNYSSFNVETSVGSQSFLGGFVGSVEGGTFSNGEVVGERTNNNDYAGGFAGKMNGAELSEIKVVGDISGNDYIGGFIGCCSTATLTQCSIESNVSGRQYVSGVVGALENTTSSFNYCFHKGTITATGDYTGGVVGISKGGCIEEMESCSHFGDMNGQNYVGGLIGAVLNLAVEPTLHIYHRTRSNNTYYYRESITSGVNVSKPINNCTSIGNIFGYSYVGGLIGSETTVKSFSHTWTYVEAAYNEYFHGDKLIRDYYYFYDENNNNVGTTLTYYTYTRNVASLSLINNYYNGTIQGSSYLGGIVGYKSGGTIQNNYTNINIYGSNYVGGIVGKVSGDSDGDYSNTTTIKSNVAIISTLSGGGRIYGVIDEEHTIIGALGSSESNRASAQARVIKNGLLQDIYDDLQNGTSIGSSALKLKANYVSWGWNFDDNWNILETESFPYKKYQTAPPIIESELVSQSTAISGNCINGGTVYLKYKDRDLVSTESSNHNWTFEIEPLQSGASVQLYADAEGMTPSYFTKALVGFPGSGTEEDPWQIYSAEDLQGIFNSGYYIVMNDIDLTQWIDENSPTKGWVPVGRNGCNGIFIDGDNHTISGLWISNNTTERYNGLFSSFSNGLIKNMNVEVASGKTSTTSILIGRMNQSDIINCSVKGNVQSSSYYSGLLVADVTYSNITNCSAVGDIDSSGTEVGGLVGNAEYTTFHSGRYEGSINQSFSTMSDCGGLVGSLSNSSLVLCNSACSITATDCYTGSDITGVVDIGGLVGSAYSSSILNCKSQTDIIVNARDCEKEYCRVGGLVGFSRGSISSSFSEGNIISTNGNGYVGGLVGYGDNSCIISNCYSAADVSGSLYTGGLVGYTCSSIDKCYAKGDVNGIKYGAGVIGELDGSEASLTNCAACNNIINLTDQSSWGCRVIGGYKNGAADPEMSNYALSTMQVSLNNVAQIKTDDLVEGIAKTPDELMQADTYIGLGWDFEEIWYMNTETGYPDLLWNKSRDAQSISLTSIPSMTYGDDTYTLPVSTDQGLTLSWTVDDTNVASISGNTLTINGAGNTTITATQTGNEEYAEFSMTYTLTVAKASLTITADNKSKMVGTENPELTVTYDGFVNGDDASSLTALPSTTTTATVDSPVGTYPITASGAESSNYDITYIEGTLTVSEEPLVIDDTDISQLDNVVYIEPVTAYAGNTMTLSIKMKNTVGIQTVQFDLYLPEDVEVLQDEDDYELIELSTERTTARKMDQFSAIYTSNGAYRVLINSTRGNTFDGTDGEIVTAQIKLSDDIEGGDYPIIFRDIVLVDTNSEGFETDFVKSTLSVPDYLPGDVNNDGKVNAIDLNAITNYILEHRTFPFTFNTKAADINTDTKINAIDLNAVTNMILHSSTPSGIKRRYLEAD